VSETEDLEHRAAETGEPSFEQTLMSAFHDLWKYRLWVGVYWVLLTGLVTANSLSQTPYYRAAVEVLVNASSAGNAGERETLKNLSLQEVMITSPKIADAVVAKMKLKNLPYFGATEDASMTLLNLLSVKSDTKSGTLEIRFDFTDPQNAAAIANEIANIYVHSTSERSEGTTQGSLEALKQQLQAEQTKQNEIRTKISKLSADFPELTEQGELQEQIKFFNGELLKAENRLMEIRSVLDELDGYLKRGESVEMHPYIRNHPNIANKLERIRELELLLVELKQEYREMHPEVTKTNAKLTALRDVLKGDEEKIIEELRGELRSRERNRDEIRGNIQKIQARLQGATPEKIKYRDLATDLVATDESIRALTKRMSDFVMEGSLKRSSLDLEILKFATPPRAPFKPNTKKSFLMALAFGIFSSVGVFFLKHYFNRTVHRPEEVYRLLRRPLVGQILRIKKSKNSLEPEFSEDKAGTPSSAMVGLITANSDFLVGKEKGYSILVTSSVAGEGKTFAAYHIARACAAKGKKTILIDADFCRARLTRHFAEVGIKSQNGLDEYLEKVTDERGLIISTFDPMLDFIGSGVEKSSAPHAFMSSRIKDLIAGLKASYDIVLFDSPPVLPVNDAVALSPSVDLRLFVINAGRTSQKDIHHALGKIDPSRQALTGVILNQVPNIDRGYDYYKIPVKK
jgi:polysaccharide biosynthesis transport protein